MNMPTGRLPGGLAAALRDAFIEAEAHKQHHGKEPRHDEKTEFLEKLESEAVETVQQMIGHMMTEENLPGPAGDLFKRIAQPEHQIELAALVSVIARLAWDVGGALLMGPMSRLSTASLRNFGDYKPSPEFAASAVARHRIDRGLGKAWMDDNGFTEVDIDRMVDANWQSVPPGTALALLQQGKIDQGRFLQILDNNAVDGASKEDYLKLRYTPPSAAAAIDAVTQNQLPAAEAMRIMAENGLDPDNFQWLYETNGRSPGVDWLNRLFNYGLIDETLYREGILESPIKNKYIEPLMNSRFRYPPMEQSLSMVRRGIITRDQGYEYLLKLGYFPEDAGRLADWAAQSQSAETKELSAANVRGMYVEGLIDRGAAEARISAFGYNAEDTRLFLDYADAVRLRQRTNSAIGHVRAQYLHHRINEGQAISAIDQLGVPGPRRDEIMHDWRIEHEVTITHLSDAVILKAGKAELLTSDEVYSRLIAKGYLESDATLLMETHGIGTATKALLKDLTVAQLLKLMAEERLAESVVLQRLLAKGYNRDDAQKLIDSKLARNPDGSEA